MVGVMSATADTSVPHSFVPSEYVGTASCMSGFVALNVTVVGGNTLNGIFYRRMGLHTVVVF